jgi:hypothetical protein
MGEKYAKLVGATNWQDSCLVCSVWCLGVVTLGFSDLNAEALSFSKTTSLWIYNRFEMSPACASQMTPLQLA